MLLTILKEIINWVIFRKGWKYALIAFIIAALDASTWLLYTGDARIQTPFETIVLFIGMFYIVSYIEPKKIQLSEQELRWIIRKFYKNEPSQVYSFIIIFILLIFYGYITVNLSLFIISCLFFINTLKDQALFGEIIEKSLYCCVPTIFMVILFKILLEILVTSRSVIDILSYAFYEFSRIFLNVSLVILLVFVYINLFCDNLQKQYFIKFSGIFLRICIPICFSCEQLLSGFIWCQNCAKKYFNENLSKCASGNEIIDKIIEDTQLKAKNSLEYIEWISYDDFESINIIGKGKFGTVYSAVWKSGPLTMLFGKIERYGRQNVAIKSFGYSDNISQEFLRKLNTHIQCVTSHASDMEDPKIIRCYGLSKDPITEAYLLVMNLEENRDLHYYLQKNFSSLKWNDKLTLLNDMTIGLKKIHEAGLLHHNFHTGNVLIGKGGKAYLADLGLNHPVNEESSEFGVYGVLPFVAPEVLRGDVYTAASDVYSFGMIMWVLTSGQNPFFESDYDSLLSLRICKGERPVIVEGTPKCYVDLMKRCWDKNILERPSAIELERIFRRWCIGEFDDQFLQADNIQTFTQIKEVTGKISQFIKYIEISKFN
jgi:serine/threonine protein kinase